MSPKGAPSPNLQYKWITIIKFQPPDLFPDSFKERFQFFWIETAIAAHAAAQVDSEGLDLIDRLADVAGVQATGEENGHRGLLDDLATQAPVVDAAGAALTL